MKAFFEKFTFGFIMAQFFPGLVAIISCTLTYSSIGSKEVSVLAAINSSVNLWTKSIVGSLALVFLSICAGMAIHGLHWAVLGFLERYDPGQNKCVYEKAPETVACSFWHDKRMIIQFLLGPIKICCEIFLFLFKKSSVRAVAIEENIPFIPNDRMEQLHTIQDFYLYFAQFYAHTSYALLTTLLSLVIFSLFSGFTARRVILIVLVYIGIGFFFIISRIQFRAQFVAEYNLRKDVNEV